jgi:hypothetical protein
MGTGHHALLLRRNCKKKIFFARKTASMPVSESGVAQSAQRGNFLLQMAQKMPGAACEISSRQEL